LDTCSWVFSHMDVRGDYEIKRLNFFLASLNISDIANPVIVPITSGRSLILASLLLAHHLPYGAFRLQPVKGRLIVGAINMKCF